MITLSFGIKILAVCPFIESQSTRVTDGQTDRQNYDPQDRANIAASRGKNTQMTIRTSKHRQKQPTPGLTSSNCDRLYSVGLFEIGLVLGFTAYAYLTLMSQTLV